MAATPIPASPVTVFVGPNNSGKSKVLAEIEQFCRTGQKSTAAVILEGLTSSGLPADKALEAIEHLKQAPNPGESLQVDHIFIGSRYGRQQIHLGNLTQCVQNPSDNPNAYCTWFLIHSTLMLDGRNRINLVNPQPAGDLQLAPQSSFQVLFRDDAKRREARRIVCEAFGSYFVIDPTNLGQFRIRLSRREPVNGGTGTSCGCCAVPRGCPIDRSRERWVGIITELMAGDPCVLLIDEPEAFLHPSLASKLGYEVARAALPADKRYLPLHTVQPS
jgi:hypothetical protein